MTFEISVDIGASARTIWDVLVDVERWPEWTRSVERAVLLDGAIGMGADVALKQPKLPETRWTVTEFAPERSFTWEARSPGVTTVAEHIVRAGHEGRTNVTLRLRQSGALALLTGAMLGDRVRRYVRMEADGLERRAEAIEGTLRRTVASNE